MSTNITKTSSSTSSSTISEEDANDQLRRGPWTVEEDNLLIHYISSHGEGRWNSLAKHSGLKRSGKSCRLRWLNYLKPDVKRGNLTSQEQLLILELHSKLGNRWSKIAQYLPGRTDNEIKNYWRTRVQKQARHLKIDPNSAAFQEVIRCLWMPRLLQKINGSSSSPSFVPTQHEISPPQQVHAQFPLDGSNATFNLDRQLKNSSSDSIDSCSDQSVNISSNLEIKEQPICDNMFSAMGQSDYNTPMKGCYNVDNTFSFDMQTFNQPPSFAMADFSQPIHDCHMAESNWSIDDDVAYGLWNMEELWELQNSST